MPSSVMIWSVESVLLGLWALVLASYSTRLHVFVARSHVLISAFTLVLHLYVRARNLVVASAVSQAFVCSVTALFLGYLAVLFANDSQSNPTYFNAPSVGMLRLDACAGLAWFAVAFINSVGMALSSIETPPPPSEAGNLKKKNTRKTSSLMFHPYGFHLVAVLPSLMLVYVSGFVRGSSAVMDLAVSDSVYITACILTWVGYVVCSMSIIFRHTNSNQRYDSTGSSSQWIPPLQTSSFFMENLETFLSIVTGCYLIVVTFIAMLALLSWQQRILAICLVVFSTLISLPNLSFFISRFPVLGAYFPNIPAIDRFFSKEEVEEGVARSTGANNVYGGENTQPTSTSNPALLMPMNVPPMNSGVNFPVNFTMPPNMTTATGAAIPPPTTQTRLTATSSMFQSTSHQRVPRLNLTAPALDPAAVSLNHHRQLGRSIIIGTQQSSREKII